MPLFQAIHSRLEYGEVSINMEIPIQNIQYCTTIKLKIDSKAQRETIIKHYPGRVYLEPVNKNRKMVIDAMGAPTMTSSRIIIYLRRNISSLSSPWGGYRFIQPLLAFEHDFEKDGLCIVNKVLPKSDEDTGVLLATSNYALYVTIQPVMCTSSPTITRV